MALRKFTDLVGTLTVVLGLVFVGLEIRQNTDAVRGATIQALAEMSQENALAGEESPELRAELLTRPPLDLSTFGLETDLPLPEGAR